MKRKLTKRIWAILLACAMVVGLFPATALAAPGAGPQFGKNVTFQYTPGTETYESVSVVCEALGINEVMTESEGVYSYVFEVAPDIAPGDYEYQFAGTSGGDVTYFNDPENPDTSTGGKSLLHLYRLIPEETVSLAAGEEKTLPQTDMLWLTENDTTPVSVRYEIDPSTQGLTLGDDGFTLTADDTFQGGTVWAYVDDESYSGTAKCITVILDPLPTTGNNQTDYRIVLTDEYSDSWNGNQITVYVGEGEEEKTYLLSIVEYDTSEKTYYLSGIDESTPIRIEYTKEGEYPEECGVSLYAPGQTAPLWTGNLSLFDEGDTVYPSSASTLPTTGNDQTDYRIVLTDEYSDSWNGNQITVYVGEGEEEKTYLLSIVEYDTYEKTYYLSGIDEDTPICIEYTKAGEYPKECGVSLYPPAGNVPLWELEGTLADCSETDVLYNGTLYKIANYSALLDAMEKIPVGEERLQYSNESLKALDDVVNGIAWGLPEADQATVDQYTETLLAAIAGLEEYVPDPDAETETLTLQEGDTLIIQSDGYRLNGAFTSFTGNYELTTGKQPVSAQVIVESGRHRITLRDLFLDRYSENNSPFIVSGANYAAVDLILEGENALTALESCAGLEVRPNGTLQIQGDGILTARGGDNAAGIGGNEYEGAGTIVILSGTVNAISEGDGAGIGGGYEGGAGTIVIRDGTVYAECLGDDGAGIGCGDDGNGGTISIYGGTVTALSMSDDGSGIGGADTGNVDSILITGGTITARGNDGAGIGGGEETDGGTITILGGTLTVSSLSSAAIGGGTSEGAGTIRIENAVIFVEDYDENMIGADNMDSITANDSVIFENVSIFADPFGEIGPAPTNSAGTPLVLYQANLDQPDGFTVLQLTDGSTLTAYVKDKTISAFLPEGVTVGDPPEQPEEDDDVTIPPVLRPLPDDDFTPVIIEGAGASWQTGSEYGLSFTSNAEFDDFLKVQVDGTDVSSQNYEVKEGSTIVILKASYLTTLAVGEHTLSVISSTGTASTTFTIKAAQTPAETTPETDTSDAGTSESDAETPARDPNDPQTGDAQMPALWITLLLLSGGAFGVCLYRRRKQ